MKKKLTKRILLENAGFFGVFSIPFFLFWVPCLGKTTTGPRRSFVETRSINSNQLPSYWKSARCSGRSFAWGVGFQYRVRMLGMFPVMDKKKSV